MPATVVIGKITFEFPIHPDAIVQQSPATVKQRTETGAVVILRPIRRTTWVYRGDNQMLRTKITFEGGRVTRKAKG